MGWEVNLLNVFIKMGKMSYNEWNQRKKMRFKEEFIMLWDLRAL